MTTQEINGFDDLGSHGESNCCGAPVYDDTDICSECKEHCSVIYTCPECFGNGKVDILDQSRINSQTISPPYKTVVCENCNGEGYIEE
jgi:DnaJ-class molecular chaperone